MGRHALLTGLGVAVGVLGGRMQLWPAIVLGVAMTVAGLVGSTRHYAAYGARKQAEAAARNKPHISPLQISADLLADKAMISVANNGSAPITACARVMRLYVLGDDRPIFADLVKSAYLTWITPDQPRSREATLLPGETRSLLVATHLRFSVGIMLSTEPVPVKDGQYGMQIDLDGVALTVELDVQSGCISEVRISESSSPK